MERRPVAVYESVKVFRLLSFTSRFRKHSFKGPRFSSSNSLMLSLQTIEEDALLDIFNNATNTFYRASGDDSASFSTHLTSSTNDTMSNNIGAGRVLGNLYDIAGKRLERALGEAAHRAGFGPEATYRRIRTLYFQNWEGDHLNGKLHSATSRSPPLTTLACIGAELPAFLLRHLCLKLFEHTQ